MPTNSSGLYIYPVLTAIAIKYRGDDRIADDVMPRTAVGKQEFIHLSDRIGDWITPPDTMVGRTGKVTELATSLQDPTTLATVNQGLDEAVANQDEMNGPNESALGRATQRVTELVELRREMRVAGIVETSGNYANTSTLSGTSQWSDFANSDPIAAIKDALDIPWKRPNRAVMGRAVWTKLSQHPKLVQAVHGIGGATAGIVSKMQFAELFELEQLHVGSGWVNSAAKGQTPVKVRIWGKHLALLYMNPTLGGPDGGTTWGYTAQFGTRVAATMQDPKIGLWGGVWVRAGESVKEVVAAPEFGFRFVNAVA